MENSLQNICSQPEAKRDEDWENHFLDAFKQAKILITDEEVKNGPDGWPYVFAQTDVNAEVPVPQIVEWMSENGIGLVLNANKEIPDYVFTYGMIWNFRESGLFLQRNEADQPGQVVFEEGKEVMVGPPSQQYLPPYVAKVLLEFFNQQELEDVNILLVSQDGKNYDLCFSVESIGNPPKEEYEGILEAIAWFLPSHYSIMLISEEGLPDFYSLKAVANGSVES